MAKDLSNRPLTQKKKDFVEEFITNGYNPRKAYRKIYPAQSDNTVNNNAYVLLHEPCVQKYINELREKMYNARMIDVIRVNNKLAELAFDDSQSPTTQITALKQLSKNLGLELERKEVTIDTIEVGLVIDNEN